MKSISMDSEGVSLSNLRDQGFIPYMGEVLKKRLDRGGVAEGMGFHGMQNKVVADIGTRDGRFVKTLYALGAQEVYGIDPDLEELTKAIANGVLDSVHAVGYKVEDVPSHLLSAMDVAVVLNYNVPLANSPDFWKGVKDLLKPGGQALVTVAENEVLRLTLPTIRRLFNDVRANRIQEGNEDFPHANLVVFTK